MSSPEFYTTGAPSSAISIRVDHYLDFEPEDCFGHNFPITTLNKAKMMITDPIGSSAESKNRMQSIVKEAQEALAPFTTKTELWGDRAVGYIIRKWRLAFVDAIMIGRILKVSNNDYSKFSVDNVKSLSYRLAGLAPGQEAVVRDNMPNLVNQYLDLCEKLESICVPYMKQFSEIFDLLSAFFVDTDPEKKLPSLLAAFPFRQMTYALDGTTDIDSFYAHSGNNIANMLARFEQNIDAMSVIEVDGKNYASDLKTALAKAYKRAPVNKGFFRDYITKPLPWYAHKMKAAQFRNASTMPASTNVADAEAGTLTISIGSTISPEVKAAFDNVILDLYTDSSWKDASRAMAAQMLYQPVANRNNNAFTITGTTGFILINWVQWTAANTYDDTVTEISFDDSWSKSHSTNQDDATRGLRAWINYAQCYSDAPLEFADHHSETWMTGKIDDKVKLTKAQRQDCINLIASCIARITPKDAMQAMQRETSKKPSRRGKKPENNGKKE